MSLKRAGIDSRVKNIGALLSILVVATSPANAGQASQRALFEVIDVNRDTVPAGTPAAFEAAFGPAPRNEALHNVYGSAYLFVPLALIPLPDGRVALISTATTQCDNQTCSGLNSVHYLEEDKARYQVDGEWLSIGTSGVLGNPARRWGWTDAIADVPVLYTEGDRSGESGACIHATLTALTPVGPVEIASLPIHSSTKRKSGTGDIVLIGTITAAEKGRSFTISYDGTQTFSERYVRGADGRYEVQGGTRVPGC